MSRVLTTLVLLCALGALLQAQGRNDWQSVAQLSSGDRIRMTLKTGAVDAVFGSWTPEQITAGAATTKKEDVLRIERYGKGGSRGKHVAIGAAIGFGGGFAIGAIAVGPGCRADQLCIFQISRGAAGAVAGGAGAVVGAIIGAVLPTNHKDLIYSAK